IRRARVGQVLLIHGFRRDELMTFSVVPESAPADTCELCLDPEASIDVLARRGAWLGGAD
ncbi:MAG: hypothetical protein WBM40_22035, partial [Thiohalocapsa sp.]